MADLDFPTGPVDGQVYTAAGKSWTYSSAVGAWNLTSSGAIGVTGFTGSLGYSGSVGFTGSVGTSGYNGSVGFTGSGSTGFTGSQGAGYTGSAGSLGYTGSAGILGFTGSAGAGYNGSVGFTGSAGLLGYSGSVGLTGFTGSAGAAGFNGSRGFTGSVGFSGSAGYNGSAGPVAGTNQQVVFNDSGSANGSASFVYDKTNTKVTVNNAQIQTKLNVGNPVAFDFGATALVELDGQQNTYVQVVIQNANTGIDASSDLVITNDSGNNTFGYLDIGINSTNYNNADYTVVGAGDAYIYVSDTSLSIGTQSARPVIFHANGTLSTDEAMRIAPSRNVGIANTTPSDRLSVGGSTNIQGTLAAGNTTVTGFVNATSTGYFAGGINPRVVSIADGTSITVNTDITDIATQINTQAAGTLTINAPTGTATNGEKFILRIKSTNVQTFSWNAAFGGSVDMALPTATSGSSLTDYLGFQYDSTAAEWHMIAKNFGF
jgi:hypothetical protein